MTIWFDKKRPEPNVCSVCWSKIDGWKNDFMSMSIIGLSKCWNLSHLSSLRISTPMDVSMNFWMLFFSLITATDIKSKKEIIRSWQYHFQRCTTEVLMKLIKMQIVIVLRNLPVVQSSDCKIVGLWLQQHRANDC